MASVFIEDTTSLVLVESRVSANMPYIVYCPDLYTTGRLITIKDMDGFVSSGNAIYISSLSSGTFYDYDSLIEINQPFGFVTLLTNGDGSYSVTNSFALPPGVENLTSNVYTETTTIRSNVEFIDVETENEYQLYASSGSLFFDGIQIGDLTTEQLDSTIANLGTFGYLSTLPAAIESIPSVWVATGMTSNQAKVPSRVSTPTGSIQYSYDGSNFSNAIGGFNQYGTAVVWGNGVFVATGANCSSITQRDSNTGFLQYSYDGVGWQYSEGPVLGISSIRSAVSYGGGLYHAVGKHPYGGNNTILWSSNAKLWNSSIGAQAGYGIVHYVVVGDRTAGGNTISSSENGFQWTDRGDPFGNKGPGRGVAWNSSIWVAVGGGPGSTIATSVDGITWTPRGDPFGAPANGVGGNDVVWNGSMWLATGSGTLNTVVRSMDGINWIGGGRPITTGNALGWNGSYWLLVGSNPNPVANAQIWKSLDGINWSPNGSYFTIGSAPRALSVGWNGSYWLVGGQGGSFEPQIIRSSDGDTWGGYVFSVFSTRCTSVTWNGSYWVATGGRDAGNTIATSPDGSTWTVRGNPYTNMGLRSLWDGQKWFGVGFNTSLLTSENGVTWTYIPNSFTSLNGIGFRPYELANGIFETSNYNAGFATGVAYGNNIWVCSGSQNLTSSINSLLHSSNGINWYPAQTVPFTGQTVYDVSFDGTKFIAICSGGVGDSSNLTYSYDGKNWLNVNLSGTGRFSNAGRYLTGNTGEWILSLSTTTWEFIGQSMNGFNWDRTQQENFTNPANATPFKPYFDGSRWLVGISTNTTAQTIYQSKITFLNEFYPVFYNTGINSGFSNGGVAYAFARSLGYSNATAYFNGYVNSLYQTPGYILNIDSISTGTLQANILTVSSLFTDVTTATTNNQYNEFISTILVNQYSVSSLSCSLAFISSLSCMTIDVARQTDIGSLHFNVANVNTISTVNTITGNLELNAVNVTLGDITVGTGNRSSDYNFYTAIGRNAGITNQEEGAVAIGFGAGCNTQQAGTIAIGYKSGSQSQRANAIAIGAFTGETNQIQNSIIINATGKSYNPATTINDQGLFVKPIRNVDFITSETYKLGYDTITKEVLAYPADFSSSFNIYLTSSVAVNLPSATSQITVQGLTRFTNGSNTIQFGGSQASNGMTLTYNTFRDENNAEFIGAKPSANTGGGFDFYTSVTNNLPATASNFTLTIQNNRVGVNISSPSYSLDVLGLLRADYICTFGVYASTINGIEYSKTIFTFSNVFVRNSLFASSLTTTFLSVKTLTVTGTTNIGTGCNATNPNNPDLQTSNLNFYMSGQGRVDQNKNYIQNTISSLIFNSTLSVNRATNCVGINMSTPLHSLDVRGNIYVTSTIIAPYAVLGNGTVITSDSNIKENIEFADLQTCYEYTKAIPLRYFHYKSPFHEMRKDKAVLGFLAQEVQPIFPKSVQSFYNHEISTNILYLSKDQVLMAHYGATQYIINRLEYQSTYLESLYSSAMNLTPQISSLVGGNV
jgi:hypothetical protein